MHLTRPQGPLPRAGARAAPLRRRPDASAARAPRRRPRCRAVPPDEGNPEPSIDQLAAMLSKRAAEMRLSSGEPLDAPLAPPDDDAGSGDAGGEALGDETSGSSSGTGAPGSDAPQLILPQQQPGAEPPQPPPPPPPRRAPRPPPAPVAMPPHDNGFLATDFEVFKTLGQLAVSTQEEGAGGAALGEQPVFVYIARYVSGLPFEGPATVLLKEYQAASTAVAATEALAMQRLLGPLPERKWQAAVADAKPHPPIVQLLGWLQAPPSDAAYEITGVNADATWLVYRFEGLKPLSVLLPRMQPPQPPAGLQALLYGGRAAAAAAASAARRAALRALAARLLGALAFCHARGVAHCCLGAGSVQCSGVDDRDPDKIIVKLDNWGLARLYPGPLQEPDGIAAAGGGAEGEGAPPPPSPLLDEDSDASLQRRSDLQAAGLLLVEAFVAGTAGGEAAAALGGGEALRRLLFEVFHDDISEFRAYCEADEGLQPFVEYADDTGAWGLLGDLLRGEASAGELLRTSPFFAQVEAQA